MQSVNELRDITFFENLSTEELEQLATISRKRKFSKGEILFYEKDEARFLTLLTEGILKVYKTDPKNNEIVLHRFNPKSLVAEMAVFEEMPYPASAAFETDGEVIEIDFVKFKENFLCNPEIAFAFFKSLTQKIKYLEGVIALNIVLDSTARVAKYICENEEALEMKHNQLAQYLHMTPETLSRIFKKFAKLGFIVKEGSSYKIENKEALSILFE
ncbi:Crp/Fnr family transcriptional regulator [Sulfurimonas paralvinellae]|uniref:Crp/Fnr family transcriptional regulator n=1 Tax=Sulfurimonas paralvinellae TaxID=317658 RepID=A0A7M1B6N1_9BACT|nr:Crp/Fnr family transcriptional regulator [Sulfurimonas paralvinellae]QOP45374.1 Crp/Fnr family transcriptional regulator [Sulfurimonas paralvinellae]